MSKVPEYEQFRDEYQLKQFVAQLRTMPDLRKAWGQNRALWRSIVQFISAPERLSLQFLQFLNNLMANPGIGDPAVSEGFPGAFVRANIGSGVTEGRLYWQILANLVSSFSSDEMEALTILVDGIVKDLPLKQAVEDGADEVIFPCLVFVMLVTKKVQSIRTSDELLVGSGFSEALVTALPSWLESGDEKDRSIHLAKEIVQTSILRGAIESMWDQSLQHSAQELALLSMVDAVLSSASFLEAAGGFPEFVKTHSGKAFMARADARLQDAIRGVQDLLADPSRTSEASFFAGQLLLKLVDIFITVLSQLPVLKRNQQLVSLPSFVDLLSESKKIPPISKLGNARSFESIPLDDKSFPHLRTYLLMIIAVLVEDNWDSQELVRKIGGLKTILECCVIDGNNPFMKERAIVCLRYLLDGNEENQTFVASLEARQVADPDALAQAGYEATIVDGKISLKAHVD